MPPHLIKSHLCGGELCFSHQFQVGPENPNIEKGEGLRRGALLHYALFFWLFIVMSSYCDKKIITFSSLAVNIPLS